MAMPNRQRVGKGPDSVSERARVTLDVVAASSPEAGKARLKLYESAGPGIRVSLAALVVRAMLLATAALGLGSLLDAFREGRGLTGPLLVVGAAFLVASASSAAVPLLAARVESRVGADLRSRLLRAVFDDPMARRRSGGVVNLATDGVDAVGALAGVFLPQLIGGIVIPLLLCAVVAFIDVPVAVVLLVAVPLVPVLLRGMEKRFKVVTERYRETADRISARFFDGVQGLRTLRVFDAAQSFGRELEDESERLRQETMALLRVNQLALFFVDSVFTLGTVVAAAGAAMWRAGSGAITPGEGLSIVILGVALIEPLTQIGRFFYVGAIGRAAAAEVRSFLSEVSGEFSPRSGESGKIELAGVDFAYDQSPVLEGVDLEVGPGQMLGVVGPSGSGKTTLAGLVSGLMTADRGRIEVDGRVALVSQQPFLFAGTVRENLLVAQPEATDDELWDALGSADLSDRISADPAGLDAQVGERGLGLSGGEAQRLTIARMFLVDAQIVVLDEPTSNIDIASEERIRRALGRLTSGKTVFLIAHRRSTLEDVDCILELSGGRVSRLVDRHSPEGEALLADLAPVV